MKSLQRIWQDVVIRERKRERGPTPQRDWNDFRKEMEELKSIVQKERELRDFFYIGNVLWNKILTKNVNLLTLSRY